jgi:hypothetical protein
MKLFSTKVHGVIDYLTAIVLFALPRLLGWGSNVTTLLTIMALTTLVYSLATRYELGLFKVLPMKGHLLLDALSGVLLLGAGFLFQNDGNNVLIILLLLGLFEIGAALLTETEPSPAGYADRTR